MKITFIGGGNMASALIAGLAGQLTAGANIHVVDPNGDQLARLKESYGVSTAMQVGPEAGDSDVIVLAVKPQQMREVAQALLPLLAEARPLLLSIAAGIRGADLSRWLGGYGAIVRTMPNTPALIGQGITGMVAMEGVNDVQKAAAGDIMRSVGATVWLDDESLIDPVTAGEGRRPGAGVLILDALQQAADRRTCFTLSKRCSRRPRNWGCRPSRASSWRWRPLSARRSWRRGRPMRWRCCASG
jgi:pyrroline-5-carboxylate reductase